MLFEIEGGRPLPLDTLFVFNFAFAALTFDSLLFRPGGTGVMADGGSFTNDT